MGNEHYCLRWSNHQSNLLGVFSELLQEESLVDVTIACSEGASIKAHKVVLSACSSYFQNLFLEHQFKYPIVILKDVNISELRALVEFMYKGEVNVEYSQLPSLLRTAENLQIKGLADMTNQDIYSSDKPLVTKIYKSNDEETKCSNRLSTALCDQYFSSNTNQRVKEGDNVLSKGGESTATALTESISNIVPDLVSNREKQSEDDQLLNSDKTSAAPTSPTHAQIEPQPSTSGLQEVALYLKKEVDWDRKDTASESHSSDAPSPVDKESGESVDLRGSMSLYQCMYCGVRLSHQSKLTRHILSHSLESLKYRETMFQHAPLSSFIKSESTSDINVQPSASSEPMELQESSTEMEFPMATGSNEQGNLVLCKFCGKNFPDVSSLITHLPIHTGDRPFKCEYCGKAFKLRHHMKDHCRVHTGERPFRCGMCGKTFSRSTILKAHEKTHYPKYVRKFLSPSPVDKGEQPQ
ncbi:zinc finger protein 135-like isoform X2 [Culicoides brevitarsis]|uniref:zinc finger protein 135-like isoform X2 n=1 Tax=Culicoides brevitarsis TaxID=469753 RepID=UPI00307B87E8